MGEIQNSTVGGIMGGVSQGNFSFAGRQRKPTFFLSACCVQFSYEFLRTSIILRQAYCYFQFTAEITRIRDMK